MAGTGSASLTDLAGTAPAGLADWQYAIGSLVMGKGTNYLVTNTEGFGSPEVRTADSERVQEDGDWIGEDTYAGRVLTLTVTVRGTGAAGVTTNYNALLNAWRFDRTTPWYQIWWRWPSQPAMRVIGRPRRITANRDRMLNGRIDVVAEFYSPYSPIYQETVTLTATPRVVTGGGRTYNLTYPRLYTVSTSGGDPVAFANSGSYPSWAILTFSGPATNPRLLNTSTNEWIGFNIVLAAGDTLVVDMKQRTAKMNGASVRHLLAPGASWWDLGVGSSTLLYVSDTATGQCVVAGAPALLG